MLNKLHQLAPVVRSFTRTNCRTSGQRVTIPLPRGRKSLPTMFSNTELFPLDWPPTTANWGKSIGLPPTDQLRVQSCTDYWKHFLNIINDRNQSLHSKITPIITHDRVRGIIWLETCYSKKTVCVSISRCSADLGSLCLFSTSNIFLVEHEHSASGNEIVILIE